MSTQVVRHTSRGVDITLNFASTENNLSWSLTQEGDGEIYDVSLTNVASYTITGGVVTLPYAVTNGSSYAVSIVKTTTGQTASITFKTRRATVKTNIINVVDQGNYASATAGRYLFVLSNTSLYKVDTELLKAANSSGAGTWTVNPIVNTYTLPVISDGGTGQYYNVMCFVYKGNQGSIFIIGRNVVPYPATNPGNYYATMFDIENGTFSNYLTDFKILTGQNIPIVCCVYDYVNNFLSVIGGVSAHLMLFDIANMTYNGFDTRYKSVVLRQNIGTAVLIRNTINPQTQSWGKISYIKKYNNGVSPLELTSIINQLGTKGGLYSSVYGGYISFSDTANNFFSVTQPDINANAILIANMLPNTPLGTIYSSLYSDKLNVLIASGSSNRIGFYNFNTNTSFNYVVSDYITSGQTAYWDFMVSNYSGLFFSRGYISGNTNRLFVYDITGNSLTMRYLDFAETITHLYTNQYLT